ncbi:ferric uptake regulator family protein [Pseudomonas sp. RIT-PI-AD]|uniref:ferric uptake regulator family protein n=1 Tax=Pseudomonas sp. RIT-PI-AD TaxID=3035294 RepID=UPI0021D8C703|nr:ferric uptake regulator family protein [Pseudomonas sp. RIT-PI-AD]
MTLAAPALAVDNRALRRLMQRVGLRCSLPRLKILDALCTGDSVSAPELHARLLSCDVPITPSCVSQVLRRLHQRGLLRRDAQKRYTLAIALAEMEHEGAATLDDAAQGLAFGAGQA